MSDTGRKLLVAKMERNRFSHRQKTNPESVVPLSQRRPNDITENDIDLGEIISKMQPKHSRKPHFIGDDI